MMEEYHKVSDAYMDTIVAKLEQLQEQREDVDVELSICSYSPLLIIRLFIHSVHFLTVHNAEQLT
jgi:frataxin-like iron-binding protein CyaY